MNKRKNVPMYRLKSDIEDRRDFLEHFITRNVPHDLIELSLEEIEILEKTLDFYSSYENRLAKKGGENNK